MAWLRKLLGIDPYDNSPVSFTRKGTFIGETIGGYKVCYTIWCDYHKNNPDEFREARMLDESSRAQLVALVDEHFVKPAIKATGRFWRLHAGRYNRGELCCVVKEGESLGVYRDHSCLEINKKLQAPPFEACGCIALARIELCNQTEELIEENYKRMIRLYNTDAIEFTTKYMVEEESILVAVAKRELDLEKDLLRSQSQQTHKAGDITITTRLAGRALEIIWKLNEPFRGSTRLYGYTKQGGFCTDYLPLENNGTCIVEAQSSGSVVMRLAEGVQHFLTFVVAWRDEKEWRTDETLRFSVRVPAQSEMTYAEELLYKFENRPKPLPTMSKKTADAVNELLSFVEFEDSISQLEKQLVEQISSKGYSPEEKVEKIDRLKAVVESLRIANT